MGCLDDCLGDLEAVGLALDVAAVAQPVVPVGDGLRRLPVLVVVHQFPDRRLEDCRGDRVDGRLVDLLDDELLEAGLVLGDLALGSRRD